MQPPQPPYGQPPAGPGGYGPPPAGPGGYGPPPGPPPGWGPPPGPPGRPPGNNSTGIVIAVIAGVLVVIGALTGAYFVFGGDDPPRRRIAVPTFTPPPFPTYTPYSPYTPPTYSPPSTYNPTWTPDVGDCVRNTGTYHKPILYKSRCTSGNYRVLRRYNGTTNTNLCASTGRTWYSVWYTNPRFVICLRKL